MSSSHWSRRRFLTSLSRSALVLPFTDVLLLATPPWARASQSSQQQTVGGEPAYEAKPVAPPPGTASPIAGTPLGVQFRRCGDAERTEGEDDLRRRRHEQISAGDDRLRGRVLRLRPGRLAGYFSGEWLAAGGFREGRGADVPSVQKQSRRDVYRRDGEGRAWGTADGARPAASAITTTMAGMTCSSRITGRTCCSVTTAMGRSPM